MDAVSVVGVAGPALAGTLAAYFRYRVLHARAARRHLAEVARAAGPGGQVCLTERRRGRYVRLTVSRRSDEGDKGA
ncbi:hypothetical protein QF032_007953 [Streptomyces achromogenes]|uniref:Secreted protein n=1 Tax=Streptomyces achromogenes TaxID=67255 RepID=A0ABU0QE45_STRAH|nr:hypothetical protein [Streptomyces achromogenes]MDQ0688924.1 hypothetical protein [Streptomyces achromogenes]MDQ0836109.1 hypothetical protein [Streptomyces achromogenes]